MDLGQIISGEREKLKLSQRALADKVGIRQATLSSIENGCDVKIGTARRILLALGMDLDVLPVNNARDKSLAAERKTEIERVRRYFKMRRQKLRALLDSLSAAQLHLVREINQKTNTDYLAELWDDFLRLDTSSQQKALDSERFHDMAWQSLLQANPFIVAGVGSWD